MKYLMGILCLDRPRTFEKCLTQLLKTSGRDKLIIAVIDNNSNEETQEVLKKYEKEIDLLIHNEWNYGYCFSVNQWMTMREPGQMCIQVDQDMIMYSKDWLEMVEEVLKEPNIGWVAARRPTAWIDRPDKVIGYREIQPEFHGGMWLEVPKNGSLIAPILIYRGDLMDKIGFENEATGYGDLESFYRIKAAGYKAVYIPDIFIRQELRPPEEHQLSYRQAHMTLINRNQDLHRKMVTGYLMGQSIYCGSRFKPQSITSPEYQRMSDINFKFHKEWPNV